MKTDDPTAKKPDEARPRPPQDLEVERALLAAVLLDTGAPPPILAELESVGVDGETFFDPRHAEIWRAMAALAHRGEPVDILTLGAELRARHRLNAVGGSQTLGELTEYIPTLAHATTHAEIALDLARLRAASECVVRMQARLAEGGRPAETLADLRALSAKLPSGENARERARMSDHAAAAWDEIERSMNAQAAGVLTVATFDVETLDGSERTEGMPGGIFAQNILTLSGVPGAGKTTLAWQAVTTTAERGAEVLVFSTEMRGPQLAKRIAATRAGVPFARLRKGIVSEEEATRIAHHLGEIARLPITIIDTHVNGGRLTADDVRSHTMAAVARATRAGKRVGLVVVDYFQDLARLRGRERASATEEQEERAAVLHDTAVSADVPMILVSSMTKDAQRAQGREGKAASTADFRGAGLDYATDVMVFLTLPENADLGDGRVSVRFEITKNRYGAVGVVSLVFDKPRGRFLPDVHRTEGAAPPWREDEREGDAVPYGRAHWQDGAYAPGGDAE